MSGVLNISFSEKTPLPRNTGILIHLPNELTPRSKATLTTGFLLNEMRHISLENTLILVALPDDSWDSLTVVETLRYMVESRKFPMLFKHAVKFCVGKTGAWPEPEKCISLETLSGRTGKELIEWLGENFADDNWAESTVSDKAKGPGMFDYPKLRKRLTLLL